MDSLRRPPHKIMPFSYLWGLCSIVSASCSIKVATLILCSWLFIPPLLCSWRLLVNHPAAERKKTWSRVHKWRKMLISPVGSIWFRFSSFNHNNCIASVACVFYAAAHWVLCSLPATTFQSHASLSRDNNVINTKRGFLDKWSRNNNNNNSAELFGHFAGWMDGWTGNKRFDRWTARPVM